MTGEPEGGPPLWVWKWIVGIAGFVALAVVATIVIVGAGVIDRFNTQRAGSARQDCRSAISAPINEITRKAQVQAAKTTQLFDQALLASQSGVRPTAAQVQEFADANAELVRDLARAEKLPDDPNVIVDHGGTIDGTHFDACPKVG